MIPLRQIVGRTTRSGFLQIRSASKAGTIALRYQSTTSTTTNTATPTTTPDNDNSKPSSETVKTEQSSLPKATQKGKQDKKAPSKKTPVNPKLRDISGQIKETIIQSTTDLNEAYSILEEGITFLREIQKSENITDRQIFKEFYPLATELFNLAQKPETTIDHSLNEIIDMFVKNKIAHSMHFIQLAANALKQNSEAYDEVLQYWFKSFEYTKSHDFLYVNNFNGIKTKIEYQPYDFTNLAIYAYVQSCIAQKVTYSPVDAAKFSPSGKIPPFYHIKKTLEVLDIYDGKKFREYCNLLETDSQERFNPNGASSIKKIENTPDKKQLDKFYQNMVDICNKRNIKVDEKVIVALMQRYFQFDEYNEVFSLFETIMNSGVKPSIDAWNIVIKAMTNPSRIASFGGKAKQQELVQNFERTLQTIVSSGVQFNGETVGAIVSGYANFGRFDKAQEYIDKYAKGVKDNGAVISLCNDGILRGLVYNGKIEEAESKLKQFMETYPQYKPHTHVMNDFLNYYAKKKNYKAINGITNFMRKHNIAENVSIKTTMINAYFESLHAIGKTPDLSSFLAKMESSENAGKRGFNEQMHSTLLKGLIQGANIEAARQLFDILKSRYPRSAWLNTNMMVGELTLGNVKLGEDIFNYYIKEIRNEPIIWNTFIHNLLARDEKLADFYFEKMKQDSQVQPNFYTYYFMLQHYRRKAKKDRLQQLVNELAEVDWTSYGTSLPDFIKRLTNYLDVPASLLSKLDKQQATVDKQ